MIQRWKILIFQMMRLTIALSPLIKVIQNQQNQLLKQQIRHKVHLRLMSSPEETKMITKSEDKLRLWEIKVEAKVTVEVVAGETVVVEVMLVEVVVVRHKRSSRIWSKPNQGEMIKPNQTGRVC